MSRAEVTSSVRVSIIIINYNYARFLKDAITSALMQTHPQTEVVVVDDRSTDESRAILSTFARRVVPVLRVENGGHAAAMNSGFEASSGELVMFLDSDDYLYADAAAQVAQVWRPNIALVQSRLDLVDGTGARIDTYPPKEQPFQSGDVQGELLRRGRFNTTVTSGLAFSRGALALVMPIPEAEFRRSGDGYLVTAAPFFGEVASVEAVVGAYRKHGGNHSQFGAVLSDRARWRLEHDEERFAVIDRLAGAAEAGSRGLQDPVHLEERLASLLADPSGHPYPGDSQAFLGRRGARTVDALGLPGARARILRLWWRACGVLPRRAALMLLNWRLEAQTRPAWLRKPLAWARAATR